jgi:hypothetical protein
MAGCHDDHDSGTQAEPLSGVFQAGGVAGVIYQTPTLRGQTDAAGTFHYLPGETVTFFIGGTELGSAPGAAAISPFTLAGLTPPSTELALRAELDRTRRVPTALGRAMNMVRLMMALDVDGNPANGLDITSRSADLVGLKLDVGKGIGPFGAAMSENISGLTANIPLEQSLALLYRAVNVTVPAHVNTRAETVSNSGFVLPRQVRSATYSPDGLRLSASLDYDNNGQEDSRTEWTYDALGRVIVTASRITGAVSYFPLGVRNASQLDAKGYRIGTTYERDYDGDDVYEERDVSRFENDAHGYVTLVQADSDEDGDGDVDGIVIQRYTYDARHNVLRSTFEADYDANGLADEISVSENSYDTLDRPVSGTQWFDYGGDGTVDYRYLTSYEYGNAGAIREVTRRDDDDDGVFEGQTVTTRTFDPAGNLLLQVQEDDDGLDGTIDSIWRNEFTYDDQRRLTSQAGSLDYDADGVPEQSQRSTSSYDAVGNILVATTEQRSGASNSLDTSATNRYQYGASGELLGMTTEVTLGNQVQPLQNATTTVTSAVLPNGVLALGQEYLAYVGNLLGGYIDGGVVGFPIPFVGANN